MRSSFSLAVTSLLFATLLLSGCVKDSVKRTYSYTMYLPVFKSLAAVRTDIKSSAPVSIQQPGKLFVKGSYIFLNEVDKGVHIIDNSQPAYPKNIAFIPIPGNVDIAVKGNTLYADLYSDLIAVDISNPQAVAVTTILENVFPGRAYYNYSGDSAQVVVEWIKKDTTINENYGMGNWETVNDRQVYFAVNASAASAASQPGTGGSMARFSIVNDRLYTVDASNLKVFDIDNAAQPALTTEKQIGFNIETVFPFKDKLFIGSSSGMFIYDISSPDQPVPLSQFTHVQSCDPVIADDDFAYVTLRTGNFCVGEVNQLDVLNIANLQQPTLVKTYTLSNPHGLSKDGNLLFICDGTAGLKLYDAGKPGALKLLQTVNGIETYDVIAYNNLALVVAKGGLYQFDYSDRSNIRQVSKLTIVR